MSNSSTNSIEFSIGDEVTHSIVKGISGVIQEYQFQSPLGKVFTLYKIRWVRGSGDYTYTYDTTESGSFLVATNKLYQYDPLQAGDLEDDI